MMEPALLGSSARRHLLEGRRTAASLTTIVGTMWCFYVFNGVSLPSALHTGQLTVIMIWVSLNWTQLVLLPALVVGQNVSSCRRAGGEDIRRHRGDSRPARHPPRWGLHDVRRSIR
jgi:hypothetical protein